MSATTTTPTAPTISNIFPVTDRFRRALRFYDATSDTSTAAVGQTAKDVVWRRNKAKLYRYRARTERKHALPLLLVHSLISRSYILDLIPGNSFVEYLVDEGFDVYLTDWGVPTLEDSTLGLGDYVLDYMPRMVDAVLRESGADELSMMGYCMGGILALLYTAAHPDTPVRNLLTLATPVDFDQMGLHGLWGKHTNVDKIVNTFGNVPAELIKQSFKMLKPASNETSPIRYISLWQNIESDKYIEQFRAFDRWTQEHIDFAGQCFREVSRDLLNGNKLVAGGMEIDGVPADPATINRSFLGVAAERDHIVPLASARPVQGMIGGGDTDFIVLPGGHVGLAAGRGARKTLWPRVAGWLAERSAERSDEAEYGIAAD